jgi:cysteinyl-tRNA synthetase
MEIKLKNTLTGKKDPFNPIKSGEVSMYNCGPTVYHYAHIGNLRSYVFADLLKRMLERNNLKVKQIINITDVGHLVSDSDTGEDKMEKGAKREGKTAYEVAGFYTNAFYKDLDRLNIDRSKINFPKATEYINEQIEFIKKLEEKGFTYKTSDGIYFDTSKFPEYGKLGNINLKGLEEGARIGVNTEKKNSTDFALWKFSPSDQKREMEWNSPWGVGFPGWHIECSAMSLALLGEEFDIHTGGIDHIPVHHNNEIAQSVCAGYEFAHFWLHNEHLKIKSENGEDAKMAKSGENFITLDTVIEKGVDPLALRYLYLTAHYSTPLEFSWESLESANTALKRIQKYFIKKDNEVEETSLMTEYRLKFQEYINDDLDTPKALSLIHIINNDEKLTDTQKHQLIYDFNQFFGLTIKDYDVQTKIPDEVKALIEERNIARKAKNWDLSDELRKKIEDLGYEVKDTENESIITKKI